MTKKHFSILWISCFIFTVLCMYHLSHPNHSAFAQSTDAPTQNWMDRGYSYWPSKPVPGGAFRAASPVYIGLLNPNHFPVLDWTSMSYMYEQLIYTDGNYKPTIPWLAESWKYLDDLTVIMTLKKGVEFHDGTPFNAESLKYQMEWIQNKENMAWTRKWLEPLKSVEVINDYTVKWHFNHPWGSFLGTLASVPGMMISAKALKEDSAIRETTNLKMKLLSEKRKAKKGNASSGKEVKRIENRIESLSELVKDGKSLDSHAVGSGQFIFDSTNPGNYLKLKRNPNWWFGKSIGEPDLPNFESIKVSVIPDPSVRLANLKAGAIDYVRLTPTQYRLVKNDPKLTVSTFPVNWLLYMALNHSKGPCKDIRVRKAISHAIDRKALVMGTQFGLGRVASCIYPDNHWAHNPNLKPVGYDPELSRKLLIEAGYANGLTIKGFIFNSPEAQAFAKAIMEMLKQVGIEWKPTFLGIAGMSEPMKKLDYDMIGTLYPWIQEPDHIATLLYHPDSPFNNGRSRNEKVIALIEAGRIEVDEKKRQKIYFQLEEALYENYEDVWLWWPMAVQASNKKLLGFNSEMFKKFGSGYFFSHPMWFKDGKN